MAFEHQSDNKLHHLSLAKSSIPSDIYVLSFDGVNIWVWFSLVLFSLTEVHAQKELRRH